jgi:hypothetical protein
MPTQRYLCLHRSSSEGRPQPSQPPSPAQMQEMYAAWNAWKEKFKVNILDLGGKLTRSGKVATAAGVTDGPFIEMKEIVGGYMIISADSYEQALELVKEGPGMLMPGSSVEIRELAGP